MGALDPDPKSGKGHPVLFGNQAVLPCAGPLVLRRRITPALPFSETCRFQAEKLSIPARGPFPSASKQTCGS